MDLTSDEMEITVGNNVDRTRGYQIHIEDDIRRKLQKELEAINAEDEILRQKLHEAKQSEIFYKNMVHDINSQIDQNIKDAEKAKEQQVKSHSHQLQAIYSLKLKLSSLQDEYFESQRSASQTIQELKEQINVQSSEIQDADLNCTDDLDSTLTYMSQNQEENEALNSQLSSNMEMIDIKSAEVDLLERKVLHLSSELAELEVKLECVNEAASSATNELKVLKQEVADMENQIQNLNSQPLTEGARGNGLFAELEDKRGNVSQKVKQVKQAYSETLQSVARSSSQLKKLRANRIGTIDDMKVENIGIELNSTFIDKIKALQMTYEKLEAGCSEAPCSVDPDVTGADANYLHYIINKPWEDVKKARLEFAKYVSQQLEVAEGIYSLEIEQIKIEKTLFLEQSKNKQLRQQIEDNNRVDTLITTHDISSDKPHSEEIEETETSEAKVKLNKVKNKPKRERTCKKITCKPTVVRMSDFDDL